MPNINIYVEDQTTASTSVTTDYAVYIPGLLGTSGTLAANTPTLFESLSAFKSSVGTAPAWLNDGSVDKSFIYACELLGRGLPVVYEIVDNTSYAASSGVNVYSLSVEDVCALIGDIAFDESLVEDRGAFDISFITTGGYPTIYQVESSESSESSVNSNAANIIAAAQARGDCFAIIDIDDNLEVHSTDDYGSDSDLNGKFESCEDAFIVLPGTSFTTSFSNYADTDGSSVVTMPGSFHYLVDFANSIRYNPSWFAIAGAKRGLVSGTPAYTVTNSEADSLQPDDGISVNAITLIRPYGRCIWGNRTLLNNDGGTTASSYINVRQLVHDIKRQLYKVAKVLMFSPNDDILWVNFKNSISPLLDKMQSSQGISGYRFIKLNTSVRATLAAKIIIVPIEAVENFELTVVLTDEETTVEG